MTGASYVAFPIGIIFVFFILLTATVFFLLPKYRKQALIAGATGFSLTAIALLALPRVAEEQLMLQNQKLVADWEARGCIGPNNVAQRVFIARPTTGKRGYGTASLVNWWGGERVILTNQHVGHGGPIELTAQGGNTAQAFLKKDNLGGLDLAAYNVPANMGIPLLSGLGVNTTPSYPGQQLLAVGHNRNGGMFTASVVTVQQEQFVNWDEMSWLAQVSRWIHSWVMPKARRADGNTKNFSIMVNGFLAPGNSGSILVSCDGSAVAVYHSGLSFLWFSHERFGWAVPLVGKNAQLVLK